MRGRLFIWRAPYAMLLWQAIMELRDQPSSVLVQDPTRQDDDDP